MLTTIADGVLVHESEFLQSNTVVVQGPTGALLVDPGITTSELTDLAEDLRTLGQPVVAGFSTHPDWDHALWHASLGDAPRYATARGAESLRDLLARPDWRELVAGVLPPENADDIPLDLLGLVTALPTDATKVPWDGPGIRILEHRAHAVGHAALLVEDRGVLVAGDLVSDILMPFLDLDADDPVGDHLAALDLLESVVPLVSVVVPGHGSVGSAKDLRARLALDRRYVETLRDGGEFDDPRIDPAGPHGWLADVHGWQVEQYRSR